MLIGGHPGARSGALAESNRHRSPIGTWEPISRVCEGTVAAYSVTTGVGVERLWDVGEHPAVYKAGAKQLNTRNEPEPRICSDPEHAIDNADDKAIPVGCTSSILSDGLGNSVSDGDPSEPEPIWKAGLPRN